jgi:predicted nucleic acid-binding protein
MKNIFVDTNIIIDLIADRKPFSKYAIYLFKKAEDNLITLYTSSHSIATTYYLLKKYVNEKELRDVLYNLMDLIIVIPVDSTILKKGFRSGYKDVEDAFQIFCASSVKEMDCIVTRNIKDFRESEVAAFTPGELYEKMSTK